MVVNLKGLPGRHRQSQVLLRPHEPSALCDRYDYKQKFEYWGVIAGGFLMISTGLILWFPVTVARFLPGESFRRPRRPFQRGVLAFLVIVIWHIYNAIFSPEVFPLDTAIFTGTISRERMAHEHPIELARIEEVAVEELSSAARGRTSTQGPRKAGGVNRAACTARARAGGAAT